MIVCSCTGVTDHDIRHAIAWMRASDPLTLITPGKIYRSLGKTPQCGGCIRLFVDHMRRDDHTGVPAELRGLRRETQARAATGG
jgi:bacterioferritin-associated ferredoxin